MIYELSEKIYGLESRGKSILKLNIGEPDWRPPSDATRILFESVENGKDRYASSAGEKSLREKIAHIHGCEIENVVVTPGSKWGIFALLKLCLGPGDNAVFFSPHWTAYELICKELGAEARMLKLSAERDWKIDFSAFRSALDSGTKAVIMNNPCNPTSRAWSEDDEKQIIGIAREKGLPVVADDAYRDLCFVKRGDRQFEGGVIIAQTFSKTFAMTGWRIGYVIAPKDMAKKIISFNQITITNVPVFLQAAALAALQQKDEVAKKVQNLCMRRARLAAKMLSPHMEFSEPDAGFYLFPKLAAKISVSAFLDKLLDKGVAVAPGAAFGDYGQHIRISLCHEEETLKIALGKIIEVISECKSL